MYFDIGANKGNWALENIGSCDKIISVEASPLTFRRLVENCTEKIIPLNYAVCANGGEDVTFYHAHWDIISSLNKDWLTNPNSRFYNQPFQEIRCKSITIDALIEIYGVPSLIKIDVEGGEYECIKSLSRKVDLLCFEWASELNDISLKCLDHLAALGFSQFYLQSGDEYTFRPQEFYDIAAIKGLLHNTKPKEDWGMIWCK